MIVDLILAVLTYRARKRSSRFFCGLKNCDGTSRIIVVNAYYNQESLGKIKRIAIANDADFIEIENKGYNYGNNMGIQYALKHNFRHLIVSNPYVEIQQFKIEGLCEEQTALIGTTITTLSGKKQNPMIYRRIPLALRIEYMNQKHRDSMLFRGLILIKLYDHLALNIVKNV